MMPGVELDWLRTYLAVLDSGGSSAAAEQVHRSQSRLSAHIAALERTLGVTLIDRSRRPPRVTHAGEVFAGLARDILAAVGSARSAVGAVRGLDDGLLTLLTTPCLAAAFLPGALAKLAAEHPAPGSRCSRTAASTSSAGSWTTASRWPSCRRSRPPPPPGCAADSCGASPCAPWCPPTTGSPGSGGRCRCRSWVTSRSVVVGAAGAAAPEALVLLARRGVVTSAGPRPAAPRRWRRWWAPASGSAC